MESPTRRVVYPLNSKHIKLAQLRQLAEALELPADTSSANLQIMVEEKLRERERVPENVQLVVEVNSEGSECLQLQDETGTFFKTATPTCSKASTPAEIQEFCSSLTSSHGSHLEQSTDSGVARTYLMVGHTIFHNTTLIVYIVSLYGFIRAFINSCCLKVHGMTNSSYLT